MYLLQLEEKDKHNWNIHYIKHIAFLFFKCFDFDLDCKLICGARQEITCHILYNIFTKYICTNLRIGFAQFGYILEIFSQFPITSYYTLV